MGHLFELIPPVYFTSSILIAFIFINVGLFIKMALFPVHSWMPNVYQSPDINNVPSSPVRNKVKHIYFSSILFHFLILNMYIRC